MAPKLKALVTAVFLLVAPACNIEEQLAKVEAAKDEIEAAVGVEASVNVQTHNFRESVTVRFSGPVAGDADEVEARVEEIVKKHFPGASEVVVLR